jgi:hypothetical protein
MAGRIFKLVIVFFLGLSLNAASYGDRRETIYGLGVELEKQASHLAQSSFEHFKGRRGEISDAEQAVLFKSEAFSSSCRLFLKLAGGGSDYYSAGYLRTNLYNAFIFLAKSFQELEEEMKSAQIMPYVLYDCRKTLDRMDYEFSRWPAADNLAYLHQKYVKARDATVYLIERRGPGDYIRRPFKNLESIFRYNYDQKREKDPWKYLVEVSYDTLEKMERGSMIDLTFEGKLVIEDSSRPNRSVYLIESGKKRGITSPQVLQRFGGWGNVFEVPAEVINNYPDGEPIR